MILPGSTLGLLGGGQLGQMFTVAARRMGYEVILLAPELDCPASGYASEHICADYLDEQALDQLARRCAAVTTEFENVPDQALVHLAKSCTVSPRADAVSIAQDRGREKTFLSEAGFPTAPYALVQDLQGLEKALGKVGLPAILKTSRLGYDGKGQARVSTHEEALKAWQDMGQQPCVLEALLRLDLELSVVVARGSDGTVVNFPVSENQHRHGILDISIVPARAEYGLCQMAIDCAQRIAQQLDYVGVMTVEFFVNEGQLLVNEIAPRPHNSGHYTIDACVSSQFEQQVRALCGLALASTDLLVPAVMVNLLGELWSNPDFPANLGKLQDDSRVSLYLYGKKEPRTGRKMGHFTCLGPDIDMALASANHARVTLGLPNAATNSPDA